MDLTKIATRIAAVYLDQPNFVDLFTYIEGEKWAKSFGQQEIDKATQALAEWRESHEGEDPEDQAIPSSQATIYGMGGSHRFFVLQTGEVVFSKYHCGHGFCAKPGGTMDKLKEIGMRVW